MGVNAKRVVKIVVTVPESHADAVRDAMGDAGAGVIGNYEHCSVSLPVEGRFRPNADANPFIGQSGVHEVVNEIQIETQCDSSIARNVLDQMCAAHPYEEVAYDIYPLLSLDDL